MTQVPVANPPKKKKKRNFKNCKCHKWVRIPPSNQQRRGHQKLFVHEPDSWEERFTTLSPEFEDHTFAQLAHHVLTSRDLLERIRRGIHEHARRHKDDSFKRISNDRKGDWEIVFYILFLIAMKLYNKVNTKDILCYNL